MGVKLKEAGNTQQRFLLILLSTPNSFEYRCSQSYTLTYTQACTHVHVHTHTHTHTFTHTALCHMYNLSVDIVKTTKVYLNHYHYTDMWSEHAQNWKFELEALKSVRLIKCRHYFLLTITLCLLWCIDHFGCNVQWWCPRPSQTLFIC